MPAVLVIGATVELKEIAEAIKRQGFLSGKLPEDSPYQVLEQAGEPPTIGFAMTEEVFTSYGFMTAEWLHNLCEPATADEGNELLTCWPTGKPPAEGLIANLFYMDGDEGIWYEAGAARITTGTNPN